MTDVLTQVLADLAAEGDRLEALVADLDDAGWHTPTPAPGWDVATQVAHLAWTDDVALKAATDKDAWDAVVLDAIADPAGLRRPGGVRHRPGARPARPLAIRPHRPAEGAGRLPRAARRCRGSARRCRPPRWRRLG